QSSGPLPFEKILGNEVPDFGRRMAAELGWVKPRESAHRGLLRPDSIPEALLRDTDRGDGAHPGNHHAPSPPGLTFADSIHCSCAECGSCVEQVTYQLLARSGWVLW